MWAAEQAKRDAEAAGRDDDSDPRPPTAGALRATAAYWEDVARPWDDDQLIEAVSLASDEPHRVNLDSDTQAAALDGFTRELLRRLDAVRPAAAAA
jgi:hypothetical protein